MPVERRGLTEDVFCSTMTLITLVFVREHELESRLTMSTTEHEADLPDPLGRNHLPPKVSRLRAKLNDKAKREPKFRFYTLYDRIHRLDVLQSAYLEVRKLHSAAGVDGVRFEDIEAQSGGVARFLTDLQADLQAKRYRPSPVRRVMIPKPHGGQRPLGIPTVRDRVVQMAVLLILEPIFEADFRDSSFGFRPGRSAHDALDAIREQLRQGKREVYDADLKSYFDTIPHDKLMKALEVRIADRGVLSLLRMWLTCSIEETDEQGHTSHRRPSSGTPQGGVISPLLANIYLHWFEVLFSRADGPAHWANATLVRYADDFVVLARQQTERLRQWIEETLEGRFGLTINREKTRVVHLATSNGESLDFLGMTMRYERSIHGPLPYLHVGPSDKSLDRARDKVRQLTDPSQSFTPVDEVIGRVNRFLRGWMAYFSYGHPRRAFRQLDKFVQDRLTRHLQRRSQRGWKPPPDRTVYLQLYHILGLQHVHPPR